MCGSEEKKKERAGKKKKAASGFQGCGKERARNETDSLKLTMIFVFMEALYLLKWHCMWFFLPKSTIQSTFINLKNPKIAGFSVASKSIDVTIYQKIKKLEQISSGYQCNYCEYEVYLFFQIVDLFREIHPSPSGSVRNLLRYRTYIFLENFKTQSHAELIQDTLETYCKDT